MTETEQHDRPTKTGMAVVVLSLVIVAALGVWALMGSKPSKLPDIELTDQQRAALIARMQQMEIKPKEGVGPIRLGMKPAEVIAVLGQPEHRKDEFQNSLHYRRLALYLVFGMEDDQLGSILCLSNTGETMSSRNDNPPLTFAGSTKDGIHVGSDFADVKANWGDSDLTITHANLYGPGKVSKHAYYGFKVWVAEKEGRVIEISLDQPGWSKPAAKQDDLENQ